MKKTRHKIGLHSVCKHLFPEHSLNKIIKTSPQNDNDISIIFEYASFLKEHWKIIMDADWIRIAQYGKKWREKEFKIVAKKFP
jgi:hypothetical protein